MFEDLCIASDDSLFNKIQCNPTHVLYKPFPKQKKVPYDLRKRKHNFTLPLKDDRNFVNRILYKELNF